ncbi:alpha/beta hydrolase fold domain-containing protein [Amycolatopsis sp. A133]|uniref:alpha/beta hydrolase n=1 Tax=Amycolatopsis sp. A133 TaxID=3064472 RepID=UPI0027F0AD4A|nr:alpha/beta hydrolase fold domain-containing protein [Amycolatopsis sp. A133]MDQ7810963.1 alpha/beta hydrolase fold domain-containing protein [Amycolatopsis sp. A133]
MPVHPLLAAKFPLLDGFPSTTDVQVPGPRGPDDGSPCLVWLHGGAFRMGDLDMREADRVAREPAHRAGIVVMSVGYRLVVGRIGAGGTSAGGNLSAGATLRLRDDDGWLPAALALVYPVLHPQQPRAGVAGGADGRGAAMLHSPPAEVRATTENRAGVRRAAGRGGREW